MESRLRVHRGCGAGIDERHSRALMQLILHEVILNKADTASRRVVIDFSVAAMSALLSQPRQRTEICLSDLQRLHARQLDRLLAAARYVFAVESSHGSAKPRASQNGRRSAPPWTGLVPKFRSRSSKTNWH